MFPDLNNTQVVINLNHPSAGALPTPAVLWCCEYVIHLFPSGNCTVAQSLPLPMKLSSFPPPPVFNLFSIRLPSCLFMETPHTSLGIDSITAAVHHPPNHSGEKTSPNRAPPHAAAITPVANASIEKRCTGNGGKEQGFTSCRVCVWLFLHLSQEAKKLLMNRRKAAERAEATEPSPEPLPLCSTGRCISTRQWVSWLLLCLRLPQSAVAL